MKIELVAATLILAAMPALGQGVLYFNNRTPTNAPVTDAHAAKLSGAAYLAQLYAGPTPQDLKPCGAARSFQADAMAGYVYPDCVQVTNVRPSYAAYVEMRAWRASDGPTYEAAWAAGGPCGTSPRLTVILGGDSMPPTTPGLLVGLQPFALSPGFVITGISCAPDHIEIRWEEAGTLQWAHSVTGPWYDLTGMTSPAILPNPTRPTFFRLRRSAL